MSGSSSIFRLDAGVIVDGWRVDLRPGAMLVEVLGGGRVRATNAGDAAGVVASAGSARLVAVGRPGEIDTHEASRYATRVELGGCVVLPALVNAHTHLDLTHIGPLEHAPAGGFQAFATTVRTRREREEEGIAASVRRGIDLSFRGGVAAVGDIGGAVQSRTCLSAWRTLRDSPMRGVSFLEFFGVGRTVADRVEDVAASLRTANAESGPRPPKLGVQPHAPYSVALEGYARARALSREHDLPLCTHLAETLDEREYIAHARGPTRAFIESLGLWHDEMLGEIGRGKRPVEHLRAVLGEGPIMAVHLNDLSDGEIEMLARLGTVTAAYCPRSSDYFRTPSIFGPHRYRELMHAGVRVVLGTDSILNLPASGPGSGRISTLDEVLHLCRRDGVRFEEMLPAATWRAAEALGLDPAMFRFEERATLAGVNAIPLRGGTDLGASIDPSAEIRRLFSPA